MKDLDFSQFDMPGVDDDGTAEEAVPTVVPAETGSRSYRLLAAPTVDGEPLRSITLRSITQADLDDLADGTLANNRALLCRLTGLHPLVIKALHWTDAQFVHGMLIDALPDFLKE